MFYGSQTGTAEEFANRLSKDAHRYGMRGMSADPEEYDLVSCHRGPAPDGGSGQDGEQVCRAPLSRGRLAGSGVLGRRPQKLPSCEGHCHPWAN